MRLLLIDDHPLVFDAISLILRRLPDDISIEFMTRLGDGISRSQADPVPDLVLLDLGLPGHSGVSSLRDFQKACPGVRVAVISATEDRSTIDECLRTGAAGFIPKTFGASLFRAAVQTMLSGRLFDPAGQELLATKRDPVDPVSQFRLTGRQMDVLRLMALGKSNGAIGTELGLAINTVKVHVAAVLEKLGARNRTEAVMIARRASLPFE